MNINGIDTSAYVEQILYLALTFGVIGSISGLIYYVVNSFFLMKLFAKANVPAWKAWVPFVNTWKLFELGGYQGALSLLLIASIIPCIGLAAALVGVILFYIAGYQIGLKNSKDGAWVVLFIFLPLVWAGILGLGKSEWNDSLGKPAMGNEQPPSQPYGTSPTYPSQDGRY